jgi:uncharacterized protein
MAKQIFWDTSGWFSLLNSTEEFHENALEIANKQVSKKIFFLTSDLVVQETMTLFMARKEHAIAKQFWTNVQESKIIRIERIDETRFQKSGEFFCKHIEHGYSFADVSSFLLMREFKISEVVTTDKHFAKSGFQILLKN